MQNLDFIYLLLLLLFFFLGGGGGGYSIHLTHHE
jgi:hypothetical protein